MSLSSSGHFPLTGRWEDQGANGLGATSAREVGQLVGRHWLPGFWGDRSLLPSYVSCDNLPNKLPVPGLLRGAQTKMRGEAISPYSRIQPTVATSLQILQGGQKVAREDVRSVPTLDLLQSL